MRTDSFSDTQLIVPTTLWESHDWDKYVADAATPFEERLLKAMRLAVHALRDLKRNPATPEALGWLLLWTRAFACLEGFRSLASGSSEAAARMLERAAFELQVHVMLIRKPYTVWQRDQGHGTESGAWEQVRSRLLGYLTMCLVNDLRYFNKRLNPDELVEIFRPTHTHDLPTSPEEWLLYRTALGEPPIFSRAEAEDKLQNRLRYVKRAVQRTRDWLADHRLHGWREQIETLPGSKDGPVFLPAVLGEGGPRFNHALTALEMGFGYAGYAHGSQVLHGGSLDLFLVAAHTEAVIPRIIAFPEEVNAVCEHGVRFCAISVAGLYGMRDSVT
jgi:hypothetical protein